MKKIIVILATLMTVSFATTPLTLGKPAKDVSLSGELGGLLNGGTWSSSSMKGKVMIVIYVDPDHRNLNEDLFQFVEKQKFDTAQVASTAIINMDATWIPNGILNSIIASKQEEYPNTIYVKDLKKHLVKEWGVDDDNSDILLFDAEGTLIFKKFGKVEKEEQKTVVSLIREAVSSHFVSAH